MWTIVLNVIKNPKVLGAIAVVAVLAYYQLSLWSLENKVEKGNIKIERLEMDLSTSKGNTKKAKEVNNKNKSTIDKCRKDVEDLDKSYDGILKGKDKTIYALKLTIADLKKPVKYPETIIHKECKFEIKTKGDNDETINSTFDNLLNIGR